VGVGRRVAESTSLVLFVAFEIPLEPLDMAVALEGEDVGREPVEEESGRAR